MIGLLVFFILPQFAVAQFSDDFETDSSANFQGTDFFGTGGSFQVANGRLQITVADANTYMVLLDNGSNFLETNERYSIEVPPRSSTAGPGIDLFSRSVPTNDAIGFRFRRQNDLLALTRFGKGPVFASALFDPDPSQPLTLFVDRVSETEFRFGYLLEDRTDFIFVSNTDVNNSLNLHIGVEAFRNVSQTFEFDNLSISATPVISPFLSGDINRDGAINFFDISSFIEVLSADAFQSEADINEDSLVNFLDIQPFIDILSGQ